MNALRKLFGPSKEEIWRQLCTETGADYVPGGFWKGDKVQATHDEWTITLDTYVVSTGKTTMVFTRLRAPYVNPDHFRFTIYRRGLFSEIAKWLGMQDIAVGHANFDRDFIIKGTDESKLRRLFANAKIRDLIAGQRDLDSTVSTIQASGFRMTEPPGPAHRRRSFSSSFSASVTVSNSRSIITKFGSATERWTWYRRTPAAFRSIGSLSKARFQPSKFGTAC